MCTACSNTRRWCWLWRQWSVSKNGCCNICTAHTKTLNTGQIALLARSSRNIMTWTSVLLSTVNRVVAGSNLNHWYWQDSGLCVLLFQWLCNVTYSATFSVVKLKIWSSCQDWTHSWIVKNCACLWEMKMDSLHREFWIHVTVLNRTAQAFERRKEKNSKYNEWCKAKGNSVTNSNWTRT